MNYYNLDVIISVGYRVKFKRGTQFRIWATNILKEYMKKSFVLDDDRLKNLGDGGYFKELLERIRDVRASEKVFYRQMLEIYATSIDYEPNAQSSVQFFKKVQNRIHCAIRDQTAAEDLYKSRCGKIFYRTYHFRRKAADKVVMLEYATFRVISPKVCANILWKDT